MTKKELKRIAVKKIGEGKSRQESLIEIKEETKETYADIANVLKNTPPNRTKQKYKILNILLLSVLILTIISKLVIGLPIVIEHGIKWFPALLLVPMINILLAYGVATYNGAIYRWVAIFAILTLLRSTPKYFNGDLDILKSIDLVVIGLLVFLGFYLKNKFSTDYETKREYYTNDTGEKRGRDIIYFKD